MTLESPDPAVVRGLLKELVAEEGALAEADKQLAAARARFDVASRKYAAVRDMVQSYLGTSPYTQDNNTLFFNGGVYNPGAYRFIHMNPGDAVVAALKGAKEPMGLDEIVETLRRGRIRIAEKILTRSVNAALMKTTGIEKTDDGKYRYVEEDLPFE
jgi:hypothetical protein